MNKDSVIKEYYQNKSAKWTGVGNYMKMGHLQNIPLFETSIEGFHSRDLYTKLSNFEAVVTQENNELGSKRSFA